MKVLPRYLQKIHFLFSLDFGNLATTEDKNPESWNLTSEDKILISRVEIHIPRQWSI